MPRSNQLSYIAIGATMLARLGFASIGERGDGRAGREDAPPDGPAQTPLPAQTGP